MLHFNFHFIPTIAHFFFFCSFTSVLRTTALPDVFPNLCQDFCCDLVSGPTREYGIHASSLRTNRRRAEELDEEALTKSARSWQKRRRWRKWRRWQIRQRWRHRNTSLEPTPKKSLWNLRQVTRTSVKSLEPPPSCLLNLHQAILTFRDRQQVIVVEQSSFRF